VCASFQVFLSSASSSQSVTVISIVKYVLLALHFKQIQQWDTRLWSSYSCPCMKTQNVQIHCTMKKFAPSFDLLTFLFFVLLPTAICPYYNSATRHFVWLVRSRLEQCSTAHSFRTYITNFQKYA